ncbi:MAG: NAD(+) kinase, partial [Sediminibacterium sp.]
MKVAIYSRGLDFEQENPLLVLLEELTRYDSTILIFHQLLEQFTLPQHLHEKMIPFKTSEDLDEQIDCLISLGGDGTLLDTVTL